MGPACSALTVAACSTLTVVEAGCTVIAINWRCACCPHGGVCRVVLTSKTLTSVNSQIILIFVKAQFVSVDV